MKKILLLITLFTLASCIWEDGQWTWYVRLTESQYITDEGYNRYIDCMDDFVRKEEKWKQPFEKWGCINICDWSNPAKTKIPFKLDPDNEVCRTDNRYDRDD